MENNWGGAGNGREVGKDGDQAGVGGKSRELYLNNNKIRKKKNRIVIFRKCMAKYLWMT